MYSSISRRLLIIGRYVSRLQVNFIESSLSALLHLHDRSILVRLNGKNPVSEVNKNQLFSIQYDCS